MSAINAIIGYPLGWIMWLCYQVVQNYGIALILFTLITKLLMYPMMVKQQKSSIKMVMFKPKLDRLQKQYANNREKLQEEMAKLYQEEGYNPMSGCLPMLIQFPILFGLIDVVYNPLKHIIRLPQEIINQGVEIAKNIEGIAVSASMPQMSMIQGVHQHPELFQSILDPEMITKIQNFNLTLFGLDLAATPTMAWTPLVIVPILSGLTSFLISIQSSKNAAATNPEGAGGGMMKGMMYIMPIFSLMFTFQVPAGVGIYWVISNVFSYIQTMILFKIYNPQQQAAKIQAEEEAKAEEERQAKIEARKKAKEKASAKDLKQLAEEDPEIIKKALTAKEINRMKLAEARKRDAEKYGEEYVEVTDEDLM